VRDAKTSSTVAAEQASQLYRDDGVSIVVGLSDTDLASPVAELSEALGTIFVTSGATGPILVQAGSHSTFLACFSDSTQASAAAHYASRTLRARSVDVMYDSSSEYAQTLAGSFSSTFAQNGGNVSSRTTFQGNSTISSATTKRVANSHGDIIFLAGQPDEVAQIIKTLRYAGITKPIIGGDSYDSSRIYDLSPSEKTNVYFTTHTLLTRTPTTPQIESFVQRYTEAYGEPPTSAFAALGYDSINLVAKAVEIAGSTEPNSVRTALESIRNFPAVTGAISYGPNRHIPSKEVTIVTFKEGIATLAGTMTSGS
jgi:branched-chain amino acid transport system substrate-binding protein